MPAMPQAIHAAAWMDPPDLPTLLPGRMTVSKRASLVRFAELFGRTVAEAPQRLAAEIARRKPNGSAAGSRRNNDAPAGTFPPPNLRASAQKTRGASRLRVLRSGLDVGA